MTAERDFSSIVGAWTNDNPATGSLVAVTITERSAKLFVHAYGACVPSPCDLGEVIGEGYSKSLREAEIVAFTAQYAPGFMTMTLTGHLEGARLVVANFNVFHDDSGRSSYVNVETFSRQQPEPLGS